MYDLPSVANRWLQSFSLKYCVVIYLEFVSLYFAFQIKPYAFIKTNKFTLFSVSETGQLFWYITQIAQFLWITIAKLRTSRVIKHV